MVIKVNRSGGGSRYPSGYTALSDHGLIGNCLSAALISVSGTVSSLCWPHFDSPSVFGRILDKDKGGHFSITTLESTSTKQQYVPSTNILVTKFLSDEGVGDITDYFPMDPKGSALPWLIRRVSVVRGELNFHMECAPAFDYARAKHMTTLIAPTTSIDSPNCVHLASSNPVAHFECDSHINMDLRFITSASDSTSGSDKMHHPKIEMDYLDLSSRGHLGLGVTSDFLLKEGESVTLVLRQIPSRTHEEVQSVDSSTDYCESAAPSIREGGYRGTKAGEDPVLSVALEQRLYDQTQAYWIKWLSRCTYTGRWRETVQRSALVLKLLTFSPTGAIVAAPTFSLPEDLHGAGRNWDYRYAWLRDSSLSVYALLRLGFTDEADQYVEWLSGLLTNKNEDGSLQIMYTIHGAKDMEELELSHLDGHKGQKPVRVGNGAASHLQLDIYGELLDAIYLSQKFSKPLSYDKWVQVRDLVDFVCTAWDQPDLSIWEVRGERQNFLYSKVMCWVAIDRGLRLADKRSLPAPNRQNWLKNRDELYEQIQTLGFNQKEKIFSQSYESPDVLDSAVLIMPLVFFCNANDPRFLNTLTTILKTKEQGGLTENGLVYRYDVAKVDDGTGGGEEGAFAMTTLWAIEALSRTSDPLLLAKAVSMLEDYMGYSNHLGLFSEEISKGGESLGNFPQAFSHTALISTCFNLDRATKSSHR